MIAEGASSLWNLPIVVGIAPLVAAGLIAGAGALFKGVGGWLGGRSKQQKAKEAARLAREAAVRGWDQKEATRIALLKSLQSRAGVSGPKVAALLQGLDPSMFEARPYTGAEIGQESGTSTLGSILSGVGGVAQAYGDYQTQKSGEAKRDAEQLKLLCAIVPSLPDCQAIAGIPNVPGSAADVGGEA
jgi:hypothetical protein